MRKNRKIPKKRSVMAANSMRFGAIIVFFFVMVILNLLSSSSCTMLLKEKGLKERELAKLEEYRTQEATRWEQLKTTENIEAALLRHGLSMKLPRAEMLRLTELLRTAETYLRFNVSTKHVLGLLAVDTVRRDTQ